MIELRGRLYKMSSLAAGGVSLIFHIDESDADSALRIPQRPGTAVVLSVRDR